jgi:RNA polymerase sigma-70 factor (ECF subfamily)
MERRQGSVIQLVKPGPEPDLDDADLVNAFCKGEDSAAHAIWTRHSPLVFRVVERTLGPDADAEDLTQDVFLRTFAKLRHLRDRTALRSFIYSITLRTLKWELRRRRVRRVLHLSSTGRLPEVPVRGADNEARQILTRFYALLEQLGASERTAFVLRHMEGHKLEEVASQMGISLATVKRLVGRASSSVSMLVEADRDLSNYFSEQVGSHARR